MSKFAERLQFASRRQKLEMLIEAFNPTENDRVLAVGVDATERHKCSNYVEYNYPYPQNVVGLTNTPPEDWSKDEAPLKLVYGDGRNMSFHDDSFDIAISNAVIEHVGTRKEQAQFVREMCRVARKVFITTPNFYFPFELHTRLPFVQFLPAPIRKLILLHTNRRYFEECWGYRLNLLTAKDLRALFPDNYDVRIVGSRVTLIPETLVAISTRRETGPVGDPGA